MHFLTLLITLSLSTGSFSEMKSDFGNLSVTPITVSYYQGVVIENSYMAAEPSVAVEPPVTRLRLSLAGSWVDFVPPGLTESSVGEQMDEDLEAIKSSVAAAAKAVARPVPSEATVTRPQAVRHPVQR